MPRGERQPSSPTSLTPSGGTADPPLACSLPCWLRRCSKTPDRPRSASLRAGGGSTALFPAPYALNPQSGHALTQLAQNIRVAGQHHSYRHVEDRGDDGYVRGGTPIWRHVAHSDGLAVYLTGHCVDLRRYLFLPA